MFDKNERKIHGNVLIFKNKIQSHMAFNALKIDKCEN